MCELPLIPYVALCLDLKAKQWRGMWNGVGHSAWKTIEGFFSRIIEEEEEKEEQEQEEQE